MDRLGVWLRETNPFTLVQVVVDCPSIPSRFLEKLAACFRWVPGYFDRIHHYKIDSQERYSLRFFHLVRDLEVAGRYLYEPLFCDLVVRFSPRLLSHGSDILEANPLLLVDSPVDDQQETKLREYYDGFENLLIFL